MHPHVTLNGTPCTDLYAVSQSREYADTHLRKEEWGGTGPATYHKCWLGPHDAPRVEWINFRNLRDRTHGSADTDSKAR